MEETKKAVKRTMQGEVVSTKMQKTAVVMVRSKVVHRIYKKAAAFRRRYKIHDPEGKCVEGDIVRIVECRPLSREKRWMLDAVLSRRESGRKDP